MSFINKKLPLSGGGLILSLIFVSSLLSATQARKLPSFIPSCKRDDPNINECALKIVDAARPHLAKGIAKLKVPAMEPLVIHELQVNRNNENLQLKLKMSNLTVYGPSQFVINKININLAKLTMDLAITLPYLDINTNYDVDGRVLIVPLKGKGIFKGNITNSKVEMRGSAKVIDDVKSKKYPYLQISDAKIKVKVGDTSRITVTATDNNPNAKQLIETATTFYHQNRKQVLELITPIIEETGLEVAMQIANQIAKSVPYNEILVD